MGNNDALKRVHHRIDDVEKDQTEMKKDIATHDLILRGDNKHPGIMEMVRMHNRFINKIERLVMVAVSALTIEIIIGVYILLTNGK